MRKIISFVVFALMTQAARALTVSVNGHGEISAEGMELTITEAEQDPLSGNMLMKLEGELVSNGELTVTITRSAAELTDEFCCAGQCTAGNEEISEVLHFTPGGTASWFIHYTPQPNSQETVTYLFTDNEGNRTLTVHYNYAAQAVEQVESEGAKAQKIVKDGVLYIIRDNKTYTIL